MLKKLISNQIALFTLIILFSCSILFHMLVLSGNIPYEVVWGGRLKSTNEMYQFEAVSIFVNLILLVICILRKDYEKWSIPMRFYNIAFGLIAALFMLNTIGNLLAETMVEKFVFTPLTLLSSLLSFRLVFSKK